MELLWMCTVHNNDEEKTRLSRNVNKAHAYPDALPCEFVILIITILINHDLNIHFKLIQQVMLNIMFRSVLLNLFDYKDKVF